MGISVDHAGFLGMYNLFCAHSICSLKGEGKGYSLNTAVRGEGVSASLITVSVGHVYW